jgi:hypothetical protein
MDIAEQFGAQGQIKVCLKSLDSRAKTFNFYWTVKDDPNISKGITMDHINEAIDRIRNIQGLFHMISRNIYTKNDIDMELASGKLSVLKTWGCSELRGKADSEVVIDHQDGAGGAALRCLGLLHNPVLHHWPEEEGPRQGDFHHWHMTTYIYELTNTFLSSS